MFSKPRQAPSTQVRFTRFEYETNPDAKILERELVQRAQPDEWADEKTFDLFNRVRVITDFKRTRSLNLRDIQGYWGIGHDARQFDSESIAAKSIAGWRHLPCQNNVYMSMFNHNYNWDQQSLGGAALEIVLKQESDYLGEDAELGALLIDNPYSFCRTEPMQRLVINDGDWRAPEGAADSARAQAMISAITNLAINEIIEHYRTLTN